MVSFHRLVPGESSSYWENHHIGDDISDNGKAILKFLEVILKIPWVAG